jgi:hypothetical protein
MALADDVEEVLLSDVLMPRRDERWHLEWPPKNAVSDPKKTL